MKQLIKAIVPACLLGSLCSILSGCFITNELIDSCKDRDPRAETYHAAYMHEGDIILEYTVQDQKPGKRLADRYWVRLYLDNLADECLKGDYSIHRKPLPDREKKKMTPIPIVDLHKQIPVDDNERFKHGTIDFIKQQPIDTLPQVFVYTSDWQRLYVRYLDADSGKVKVYNYESYESFIHGLNYPKLIALFPFAVIGDIVTFPVMLVVLLYVPRWPM
ncbi:MAG: hypothetical protein GX902_03935 [Lentisphaerae bacterium]|nr:hypothetical protein [Lentisphaerota bacterium]